MAKEDYEAYVEYLGFIRRGVIIERERRWWSGDWTKVSFSFAFGIETKWFKTEKLLTKDQYDLFQEIKR